MTLQEEAEAYAKEIFFDEDYREAVTAAYIAGAESQSKGVREVLQELAELKDMKDEIDIRQINDPGISEENRNERLSMIDEYLKRKPLAWEAARKLLAESPGIDKK